jgi:hypothetical protein
MTCVMEGISINDIEILWDVRELCTRLEVARSTVYGWIIKATFPMCAWGQLYASSREPFSSGWFSRNKQAGRSVFLRCRYEA